jgi:hypothetical protein
MKSLELKFGKEKVQGRDTFFSTVDLLKAAVNNIPKEAGMDVKEMSIRLRLLKTLEAHKEFNIDEKEFTDSHLSIKKTIEFEDADFAKLKELFNGVKWNIVSEFIIELSETIEKTR